MNVSNLDDLKTQGACKHNGELFFQPSRFERREQKEAREAAAKRICFTCPVRLPCREHALAHREGGVWGGMTELERLNAGAPVLISRTDRRISNQDRARR